MVAEITPLPRRIGEFAKHDVRPVKAATHTRHHLNKSYLLVTITIPPYKQRQGFRMVCARCGAIEDVSNEHDCAPHHVVKKFDRRGWTTDPYYARLCLCPVCTARPPAEQQQETPAMAEQPTPPNNNSVPVVALSSKVTPPVPVAVQLVHLTADQRRKVREKLDEFFDDARGCYLPARAGGDLYSDQRIAEELDMPRALVVAIREASYGTIKTDPEIDALRHQVEDECRRVEGLMTLVSETRDALAQRLDALGGLKRKLDTLERRLVGVA
jgi:hypothetical protein